MSIDRAELVALVQHTYMACIESRPIGDPFSAIADAILAGYLVVPRSDATVEYGVQYRNIVDGNIRNVRIARSRACAVYDLDDDAVRRREVWTGPWLPLPENGEPR